ncbi:pantothenate synthase [Thoreauomyces humboldtii]|nr:pantothenate synthase [Thoreauomyces humboldtii]
MRLADRCLSSPLPRSFIRRCRYSSTARTPRVVTTIAEYRAIRAEWQRDGHQVGFVPTMGALHAGHASLASLARGTCDRVVASIFVNPAQFAPTEDLAVYPRTQDADVALLGSRGVDLIFAPTVKEMYPAGIVLDVSGQRGTFVEVRGKSHQMEGSVRPHFFRGVATVVTKLFNIIQPDKAFFGQKDAQQCAVIRSMVRDLFVPTKIVVGDTVREDDGLAMSSRNRYLSPEERAVAPILYKALSAGLAAYRGPESVTSREELIRIAKAIVEKQDGAKLEYLSVADPFSLEEVDNVGSDGAIFSGAVKVGKTRIIDNILLGISTENVHFFQAKDVMLSIKRGGEERRYDVMSNVGARGPCANREHIGIVMLIKRYDVRNLLDDLSGFDDPTRTDDLDEDVDEVDLETDVATLDAERYADVDSEEDKLFEMDEEEQTQKVRMGVHGERWAYINAPAEDASQSLTEVFELKHPAPAGIVPPPTSRLAEIMEKTARFVGSSTNPQTEILVKAKQAQNPDFAFLDANHELHQYYIHLRTVLASGLAGIAGYSSDDDSSSETAKETLPVTPAVMDETAPGPPVHHSFPPDDLQLVIQATARSVARGGSALEARLTESHRTDPRFAFLRPWNPWHNHYLLLREEAIASLAQPSVIEDSLPSTVEPEEHQSGNAAEEEKAARRDRARAALEKIRKSRPASTAAAPPKPAALTVEATRSMPEKAVVAELETIQVRESGSIRENFRPEDPARPKRSSRHSSGAAHRHRDTSPARSDAHDEIPSSKSMAGNLTSAAARGMNLGIAPRPGSLDGNGVLIRLIMTAVTAGSLRDALITPEILDTRGLGLGNDPGPESTDIGVGASAIEPARVHPPSFSCSIIVQSYLLLLN